MSHMKLTSDIHSLNYFLNKILLGAENLNERKEVEGEKEEEEKEGCLWKKDPVGKSQRLTYRF